MNPMKEAIELYLAHKGLRMVKLLHRGLLVGDTYDTRIANSLKDVVRLSEEGFTVDEDTGVFMFNAFKNYEPKTEKPKPRRNK